MLKRVSIQNFKSLKDVTLDLQKVNLLIGPNNSGKTNFLKALEFFRNYYKKDHNAEVKDLVRCFFNKRNDEVNLQITNHRDDTAKLTVSKAHGIRKIFERQGGEKLIWKDYGNVDDEDLMTVSYYIYGLLEKSLIYKPEPDKLLEPAPVGEGSETVNADASNLVAFLDYILSEYRYVFNQIEKDLRKCVPEFTEINLQNVKSTDELVTRFGDKTFKRLGLTSILKGEKYWADELSEGTLYFLALLCIINQPNPPKLLLLEEPEKGIHPRRIWEVMKFIFQLAEEKGIQIILTTHNEHVVNAFSSMPESVFVFDKDEEGATYVRNLQKDIIEPTDRKSEELGLDKIDLTSNLGENWLYGLIGGVPADEL